MRTDEGSRPAVYGKFLEVAGELPYAYRVARDVKAIAEFRADTARTYMPPPLTYCTKLRARSCR